MLATGALPIAGGCWGPARSATAMITAVRCCSTDMAAVVWTTAEPKPPSQVEDQTARTTIPHNAVSFADCLEVMTVVSKGSTGAVFATGPVFPLNVNTQGRKRPAVTFLGKC